MAIVAIVTFGQNKTSKKVCQFKYLLVVAFLVKWALPFLAWNPRQDALFNFVYRRSIVFAVDKGFKSVLQCFYTTASATSVAKSLDQ